MRLGLGSVNVNKPNNSLLHAPISAARILRNTLNDTEANQGNHALYLKVFPANLWQMIISLLYITFNAIFTCFLVGEEWSGYRKTRKTLCVSFPKGLQRSSHFISMPLRYSVLLILSMASLHWTVSQSVSVVRIISRYSDRIWMLEVILPLQDRARLAS